MALKSKKSAKKKSSKKASKKSAKKSSKKSAKKKSSKKPAAKSAAPAIDSVLKNGKVLVFPMLSHLEVAVLNLVAPHKKAGFLECFAYGGQRQCLHIASIGAESQFFLDIGSQHCDGHEAIVG